MIDVATAASGKSRLDAVASTSGMAILAWSDSRNDSGDIFAQNVNLDGSLGSAETIPGDLDDSGVVDGADLAILLGAWGDCRNCEACDADLDGNCTVDGADLAVLLGNWG